MKYIIPIVGSSALLLFSSCNEKKNQEETEESKNTESKIVQRANETEVIMRMKNLFSASINYAVNNGKNYPNTLSDLNDPKYMDSSAYKTDTGYEHDGLRRTATFVPADSTS